MGTTDPGKLPNVGQTQSPPHRTTLRSHLPLVVSRKPIPAAPTRRDAPDIPPLTTTAPENITQKPILDAGKQNHPRDDLPGESHEDAAGAWRAHVEPANRSLFSEVLLFSP